MLLLDRARWHTMRMLCVPKNMTLIFLPSRSPDPSRKPGPILVGCWAHARRKFFELADLKRAPMAAATVKAIDVVFEIEREINGRPPDERLRARQECSRPLVADLEARLRADRASCPPKAILPGRSTTC